MRPSSEPLPPLPTQATALAVREPLAVSALQLAYALVGYVLAMGSVAYLLAFLAGVLVPKTILDGPVASPWVAALIDAGLVLTFGLHHSVTARRAFKRWWTRFVPPAIERATYCIMTAGMTALLVALWRPIPITVWHLPGLAPGAAFGALFLGTATMMVAASFHFGHFAFFGLRQALDRVLERAPAEPRFTARLLYGLVRHPISVGWMLLPFLHAHLTVGHVVFGLATVVYIVVATPFEERDLIAELGETYRAYRRRVPAFLPRLVRRRAPRREG
ncbi:MAG: methyltransferase family protein [Sandaracinaceae bacterium]